MLSVILEQNIVFRQVVSQKHILYVQYTNPAAYPPLEHSSRILANEGWEVTFLGTAGESTEDLRFPPHPRISVHRMPHQSPGWRQKVHYLRYTLWVLRRVLRDRPDWVYVSDPLATPAGLLISHLTSVPVLYHEHDTPAGTAKNSESLATQLVHTCRLRLGRRADACVLPNEQRIEHFEQETRRDTGIECVWNVPELREVAEPRTPLSENNEIRLFFHGSLSPKKLPFSIIDALNHLPKKVSLVIAGYETEGYEGFINRYVEKANKKGIKNKISFIGAFSRHKLLLECRNHHIGLSFIENDSKNINMKMAVGASNKPFDYLSQGLPVVVPDRPEWKKTYVEPGFGVACDPNDADSIALTIQDLIRNPERLTAMGEAGRQKILDSWNYETQFEGVKELINRSKTTEARV